MTEVQKATVHVPATKRPLVAIHTFPVWLPQTQTWMFNQVKYLPSHMVETHIVCEATQNLDQFGVPNIHCLRDASFLRRVGDKALRKLQIRRHLGYLTAKVQQLTADVVHSHFGYFGCDDVMATKHTRSRHVVTFYGADITQVPRQRPELRSRYRQMFQRIDLVLCEGPFMAGQVVQLGCPEEKVSVHHLGVDLEMLEYRPRVWNGTEPLRVLIAATLREKKGIPYAVEALGKLKHGQSIEVTIIGDATTKPGDAEEKARILRLIEQYSLSDSVRLLGFQPHHVLIEEAYRHHLFLSPSVTAADGDSEGGAPVSLVEMAATGMPIVSTRHCDIPEVVIDQVTGQLAEERDVDGLVDRLRWWASHPSEWRPMLDAGRRHIEMEYSCRVQGERLAATYRDVVDRGANVQQTNRRQAKSVI